MQGKHVEQYYCRVIKLNVEKDYFLLNGEQLNKIIAEKYHLPWIIQQPTDFNSRKRRLRWAQNYWRSEQPKEQRDYRPKRCSSPSEVWTEEEDGRDCRQEQRPPHAERVGTTVRQSKGHTTGRHERKAVVLEKGAWIKGGGDEQGVQMLTTTVRIHESR